MEGLHGDFFTSSVSFLEFGVVDGNVVFDVLSRQSDLFVSARTIDTDEGPVSDGGRDTGEDENEEVGLEASVFDDRKERLDEIGNYDDESGEVEVVEGAVALCKADEGGIFDSRGGGDPHRRGGHDGAEDRND